MKPRLKKFSRNSVNVPALVAAVRAIAAEHPDFCYRHNGDGTSCLYKPTPRNGRVTGCLIGEGLRRIGVSTAGLDKRALVGIKNLLRRVGLAAQFPEEASWLSDVQSNQDRGHTWGDAVRTASTEDEE